MSRSLTAADRSALIRLASTLPAGSEERRAILAGLRSRREDPNRAKVYKEIEDMANALIKRDGPLLNLLNAIATEGSYAEEYADRNEQRDLNTMFQKINEAREALRTVSELSERNKNQHDRDDLDRLF